MSSFFPTPRHPASSSSAAVKLCLLAVLATVLAGVLAIFPALLIIDCDGNFESGVSLFAAACCLSGNAVSRSRWHSPRGRACTNTRDRMSFAPQKCAPPNGVGRVKPCYEPYGSVASRLLSMEWPDSNPGAEAKPCYQRRSTRHSRPHPRTPASTSASCN